LKQQKETQTELAAIAHHWLTAIGIKINKTHCTQEITTHADYPAITSLVDFLDAGNMRYQAVQADASYIHEFNYPLLAHIKKPGNEYLQSIPNASAWDAQKETTQHWSGITIFPEKNTTWHNEENTLAIKAAQKQQYLFAAWCGIGVLFFAVSAYYRQELWYNIFGLFSLIGVFISIAAFGTELGIQSNAVKQVCGAVSKGGCETVLKSKLAKGIFGITPSDMAVLYFAAQFLVYLVAAFFTNTFSTLPYIGLLGIAIAGASIYTQAMIIKKWCALCLGIASILLLQGLVAPFLLNSFSLQSLLIFGLTILLITAILLPIKTLLKANITAKPKLVELTKWQADASIFLARLEKEQTVDTTTWENDLVIGNPNAPIMITVACNPYCGPCAKAHKELDKILEKFEGKVKVQIRLLCNPANEKDNRTIAVKAILQQAITIENNKNLQAILNDWFEWMNYEKWITKWNIKEPKDIKNILLKHEKWVTENNVTHTPTFFVNGKKLPNRYGLLEIEQLIPNLATELAI
jgi:protein-disulfide isomerase/uncharacterized membrane protein